MTEWKRNTELEEYYFNQILERLDGRDNRVPHPSNARGTEIHASDVDGSCMQKRLLRRILPHPQPRPSNQSIIRFMRGHSVESWLAPCHLPSVEKDGIVCSIDDKTDWGVSEIKATIKSKKNFHPLTTYPWWVNRCKIYANGLGVDHINLVVVHIAWYRGTEEDINAYKLSFGKRELKDAWTAAKERAEVLEEAFELKRDIPKNWITPLKFGGGRSECGNCELKESCYFYGGGDVKSA